MKESISSLFTSGRWNALSRCSFLTVNYHNPGKLIFEHLRIKEKNNNLQKQKIRRKLKNEKW